jgi:hypothetical protein
MPTRAVGHAGGSATSSNTTDEVNVLEWRTDLYGQHLYGEDLYRGRPGPEALYEVSVIERTSCLVAPVYGQDLYGQDLYESRPERQDLHADRQHGR